MCRPTQSPEVILQRRIRQSIPRAPESLTSLRASGPGMCVSQSARLCILLSSCCRLLYAKALLFYHQAGSRILVHLQTNCDQASFCGKLGLALAGLQRSRRASRGEAREQRLIKHSRDVPLDQVGSQWLLLTASHVCRSELPYAGPNVWPDAELVPGFQETMTEYMQATEKMSKRCRHHSPRLHLQIKVGKSPQLLAAKTFL